MRVASRSTETSLGKTGILIVLAMVLFACNSILCRLALRQSAIDPVSFALVRLASGAIMLSLLAMVWDRSAHQSALAGSWRSAASLFAYAAAFSFAYVALPAGIGAFLLFAAVQVTMVMAGAIGGNRLSVVQLVGMLVAMLGLAGLAFPGAASVTGDVSPGPASLMVGAGVAWGLYSLFGRGEPRPLPATVGNFVRAVPICVVLTVVAWTVGMAPRLTAPGVAYAVLSGAVASGIGYTIWYAVLPALAPSMAASVQLSVPVITALIGSALLGEALTWHFALSSLAILSGIALVVLVPRRRRP